MSRTADLSYYLPKSALSWARGYGEGDFSVRQVQRAQIILLAADGTQSQEIARRMKISRPTVQLWRQRFLALRGCRVWKKTLLDLVAFREFRRTRSLRWFEATCIRNLPRRPSGAHGAWPRAHGLSEATVRRIWQQHNLKPHLIKTFKLSRDKHFIGKLQDVVGLYLNPPDKSLVLCVDEKSQSKPSTVPNRVCHEEGSLRNHDTRLQAQWYNHLVRSPQYARRQGYRRLCPRHRHQEFIRFLKQIDSQTPAGLALHLIVDNYGTHKHPRVTSWLHRHPRFHMHLFQLQAPG